MQVVYVFFSVLHLCERVYIVSFLATRFVQFLHWCVFILFRFVCDVRLWIGWSSLFPLVYKSRLVHGICIASVAVSGAA